MPIVVSLTNLAEATAAAATASVQSSNYCSSEAQVPGRPFLPWRSTTTTADQWWQVDLGSSQTLGLVGLANLNVNSCVRIQGASSSGFGTVSYNEAVTPARNPWTGRFQHTHLTTGFGYRYLRVAIPGQVPPGGEAYYELGGVWAGTLSTSPTHWKWDATFTVIEPTLNVAPPHGGWRQRSQVGDRVLRIEARLHAGVTQATPASGDALDDWLDLQRQIWDADAFWCFVNLGDLSQGAVVRSLEGPAWRVGAGLAETPWVLEEVVR